MDAAGAYTTTHCQRDCECARSAGPGTDGRGDQDDSSGAGLTKHRGTDCRHSIARNHERNYGDESLGAARGICRSASRKTSLTFLPPHLKQRPRLWTSSHRRVQTAPCSKPWSRQFHRFKDEPLTSSGSSLESVCNSTPLERGS